MSRSTRSLLVRGWALVAAIALPALAAENPLRLGAKESGRSYVVKPGAVLEVRLSAQLGTGYSWHVTAPAGAILVQDGEPKTEPAPGGAKPMPGGPEIQVFRFTAGSAGKGDLKLKYARGFEPSQKAQRRVTYHIKVADGPK